MRIVIAAVLLVGFVAVFVSGWIYGYGKRERVLAMEWGDGEYGKRFYGAKITLEEEPRGYTVRGIVLIAPDALGDVSYRHECGVIGHVPDLEQATKQYGVIDWRSDGLHVGKYFLPRAQFENHR